MNGFSDMCTTCTEDIYISYMLYEADSKSTPSIFRAENTLALVGCGAFHSFTYLVVDEWLQHIYLVCHKVVVLLYWDILLLLAYALGRRSERFIVYHPKDTG